jgi:hypothetical protein
MWLAFTSRLLAGTNQGKILAFRPQNPTDVREIKLPANVSPMGFRPSAAVWTLGGKSRVLITGFATQNIMIDHTLRCVRQGIIPPNVIPAMTASAPAGVTGDAIGYYRWWDDIAQRGSALSAPSATATLAGASGSRSWASIPTNPNNAAVTHIIGYVSMDGATPREAWKRQVGVTSLVESRATGKLGAAFTSTVTTLGFPRCRYNGVWHNRQTMNGDTQFPERTYLSNLDEPDEYGGFYLPSIGGEPMAGILRVDDDLLLGCDESHYVVNGWTEDDVNMVQGQSRLGFVSHHANVVVHGRAIILTQLGAYVYDGGWHFAMKDSVQHLYVSELQANLNAYQDAWAINDRSQKIVKFSVGSHILLPTDLVDVGENVLGSPSSAYWVLDYNKLLPEAGGGVGQPEWYLHARSKKDTCAAVLRVPGSRFGKLYTGTGPVSATGGGLIFVDDPTNADDAGDAWEKVLLAVSAALYEGRPGGFRNDGKAWILAWEYLTNETSDARVKYQGGEEDTAFVNVPMFTKTIPQGLSPGAAPRGRYPVVLRRVGGMSLTRRYEIFKPLNCVIGGFGGTWRPGRASRGGFFTPEE